MNLSINVKHFTENAEYGSEIRDARGVIIFIV